jgi:hypothetical protein
LFPAAGEIVATLQNLWQSTVPLTRGFSQILPTMIMSIKVLSVLWGILLFAGADGRAFASGTVAEAQDELMPQKAYLVFTKESWGCLAGQEIIADVTQALTKIKGEPVQLQEVKNPEDVNNRFELYLYFPAQGIRGLAGYYVLRLGVVGESRIPGSLRLARATLGRGTKGLVFTLQAKTTGILKADLLYAGTTHPASGRFTCPTAGLFEPHPVKFLPVYPIQPEQAATAIKSTPPWDKITLPLEGHWLKEGDDVAACLGLLSALENNYSASKEDRFFWDRSKITSKSLNQIASSFEKGKNLKFYLSIELRDRHGTAAITRDPTSFVPKLRQMIAVINAEGKIIGGEVMIGLEKSATP